MTLRDDGSDHDPETGEVYGTTLSDPAKRVEAALYKSLCDLKDAEKALAETRKARTAEVVAAAATHRGAIEQGYDGSDHGAHVKLNNVAQAWQELVDAEERKRLDVEALSAAKKTAKHKLDEQLGTIRQLNLFP